MTQDSEDEVWEQIAMNISIISGTSLPESCGETVDDTYCSCRNPKEVQSAAYGDVFYVCSKSKNGCGKEIKKCF